MNSNIMHLKERKTDKNTTKTPKKGQKSPNLCKFEFLSLFYYDVINKN